MGLFRRVGDILTANLNDMIDRFEDPEKMLKQALREMEEAIADAKRSAANAIARAKLAEKEIAGHACQAAVWQTRAEAAVRAGDDEAARVDLARKREHETLAAALGDERDAALACGEKLRRQIDAMSAKLAQANRSLATLRMRNETNAFRVKLAAKVERIDRRHRAFEKFARHARRVDEIEAAANANDELADLLASAESEWNGVEPAIDAELRGIKARVDAEAAGERKAVDQPATA